MSISVHVNKTNPAVRDRVNCVNSRLRSADGEVHMFIDPRCKELINDLDQVIWEVERNGQTGVHINKSDPNRTHMSDALGYYIAQAYPLRPLAAGKCLRTPLPPWVARLPKPHSPWHGNQRRTFL